MPTSVQLSAALWGLGVGIAFFVLIYMTVRSGWFRKAVGRQVPTADPLPEPIEPIHEYPEGLSEAHGPVPAILKIVIASYVVFLVVYVAYFIRHMQGPFGELTRYLTQ